MSGPDVAAVAAEVRGIVEPALGALEAGGEVQGGALQVLTTMVGELLQQAAAQHAETQAALQKLTAEMVAQQILLLRTPPAS